MPPLKTHRALLFMSGLLIEVFRDTACLHFNSDAQAREISEAFLMCDRGRGACVRQPSVALAEKEEGCLMVGCTLMLSGDSVACSCLFFLLMWIT